MKPWSKAKMNLSSPAVTGVARFGRFWISDRFALRVKTSEHDGGRMRLDSERSNGDDVSVMQLREAGTEAGGTSKISSMSYSSLTPGGRGGGYKFGKFMKQKKNPKSTLLASNTRGKF